MVNECCKKEHLVKTHAKKHGEAEVVQCHSCGKKWLLGKSTDVFKFEKLG